jgi:hypothetical protein
MTEESSRAQGRRRVESNITIAMVCDLSAALQEGNRRRYIPAPLPVQRQLGRCFWPTPIQLLILRGFEAERVGGTL